MGMKFPKQKWQTPKEPVYKGTEAQLQQFTDEYLTIRQIYFRRFPDKFFQWLKAYSNASAHMKRWFFGIFGGIEDSTCFLPISDKYSLCLHLELKSAKGKTHGAQKHMPDKVPVQYARSPERVQEIIEAFLKEAERLKTLI